MNPFDEYQERKKRLSSIREMGLDPFEATTARDTSVKDFNETFAEHLESLDEVCLAGRLRSIRAHGALVFADLDDGTGRVQIVINEKNVSADVFKFFTDLIDMGDFVEARGKAYVTRSGQNSLEVTEAKLLTKALRPLPDQYYGFKNEEEKLRKRYLDILTNADVHDMFVKKAKFWQSVRNFLVNRGFLEVETPVLEVTTGGADARPFVTHHNALDMDVYLRISMGELWQKRLMVAGYEKTFEIGRQFRNEGMDAEHLQDYTQMEFYWGYADYEKGMELVEELYKYVAKETFGTSKFTINGHEIDLDKTWERYDYRETVLKFTGIDVLDTTMEDIEAKLREHKIEYDKKGFNITRAIDNLWKYCRKQISGPGFVVGIPITVSPLAKRDKKHPELAQRFQPILAGSEVGNGYSELNDPIDQAERFGQQAELREQGDEEAQMTDEEFVEALEYGMPPTCGFGMSERVFSFLMDKSIRECQIFPLMKPRGQEGKEDE
ncbi:lysine--tRNA ligase [Candidatus Uhrbacteria bacterium]|nr:lysine--tRNA ligase [Candidatus Uhrbacteria bacterium]